MIDRSTKLRWRRRFRRSKQQVEDLGQQTEVQLERHFFTRLSRLTKVRRFMAAWLLLFVLIIGGVLYQARSLGQFYLQPTPTDGGVFTEGVLGSFRNANPLYASGSADSSVERLVFSGLFRFDQNNNLVGELAEGWQLDARETTYTVTLKENLRWHDGELLQADDVVFTYNMIQNQDAKSPLATSWQGIKVVEVNPSTVRFTLPSILSAFPYSLTNGIVPKHVLKDVPPSQLRAIAFNANSPIGSGPFKWEAIEVIETSDNTREQRIALVANNDYVGGRPKLDRFIIRTFADEQKLVQAFEKREIVAAAGLSVASDAMKSDTNVQTYNIPLTSQVMVFFKSSSEIMGNVSIRRALAYGLNVPSILEGLGRPVLPSDAPLLKTQVGYDKSVVQKTNDIATANKLLDEAGWVRGKDGIRTKDKRPLSFMLTTQANSTYDYIAKSLKDQWRALGVDVKVLPLQDSELQQALSVHNYDALLYGISLGADPDVFAYWHSSQADIRSASRLNFAEYRSPVADQSLEGGRTRSDDVVRSIKYRPFLDAWRQDVPAVALYQPRYLYVFREPLFGFAPSEMNAGADRLNNVVDWRVRVSDQPVR